MEAPRDGKGGDEPDEATAAPSLTFSVSGDGSGRDAAPQRPSSSSMSDEPSRINACDPPSAAQVALRRAQVAEEEEDATRPYHARVQAPPLKSLAKPRELVLGIVCTWPNCAVGSIAEGSRFKRCGGCLAPYCSRNCQEGDWPRHRPECKAAIAARKEREFARAVVPFVARSAAVEAEAEATPATAIATAPVAVSASPLPVPSPSPAPELRLCFACGAHKPPADFSRAQLHCNKDASLRCKACVATAEAVAAPPARAAPQADAASASPAASSVTAAAAVTTAAAAADAVEAAVPPACRLGDIKAQQAALEATSTLTFAEMCRAGSPAYGNNMAAQFLLGSAFSNGEPIGTMDVPVDKKKACEWYERAAQQGLAWAQDNLGWSYRVGEGVAQSHADAVRWFRRAARQGHPNAQVNLGNAFCDGEGLPQDREEAVRLFRLAADRGLAQAQHNLAICYRDGVGVAQNLDTAVRLFKLAANQGHASAVYGLGSAYERGKGVPQSDSIAVRLYRRAAELGDALAMCRLGRCFIAGRGVSRDEAAAVEWFSKAIARGNSDAEEDLLLMAPVIAPRALPGPKRRGFVALADVRHGAALYRDRALLLQPLSGARAVASPSCECRPASAREIDTVLLAAAPYYLEGSALEARLDELEGPDDATLGARLGSVYSPPVGGGAADWSPRALIADAVLSANSFSIALSSAPACPRAGVPECRALFVELLAANHSCEPNAEANPLSFAQNFENPHSFSYELRARRDIAAGEEVTIAYVPTSWPLARRRGTLAATYDFVCDCRLCVAQAADAAAT